LNDLRKEEIFMTHSNPLKVLGVFLAVVLLAGAAFAQLQSGNLFGTAKDDKGAPLPGRHRHPLG
jgi:hypothetical protein